MIITIDGPVASGKSSIAKALAKHFGYHYLNTGLLYRAVAYLMQTQSHSDLAWLSDVSYEYCEGNPQVLFRGMPITVDLYNPTIDQEASRISVDKDIREALLPIQRSVGAKYDIVADGRDCGSIVFPEATVKLYLTADEAVRAERLMIDKQRHYATMPFDAVVYEIAQRDARDIERQVAPLIVPEGGIVVDASGLTFDQTLVHCIELVEKKTKGD